MQLIDLTGKRFGRWVVLSRAADGPKYTARWSCRCDCGTERAVDGVALRRGKSRGCRACHRPKRPRGPDVYLRPPRSRKAPLHVNRSAVPIRPTVQPESIGRGGGYGPVTIYTAEGQPIGRVDFTCDKRGDLVSRRTDVPNAKRRGRPRKEV